MTAEEIKKEFLEIIHIIHAAITDNHNGDYEMALKRVEKAEARLKIVNKEIKRKTIDINHDILVQASPDEVWEMIAQNLGLPMHSYRIGPNYTKDLDAAWSLVGRLILKGWAFTLGTETLDNEVHIFAHFWNPSYGEHLFVEHETPLAICKAYLSASWKMYEKVGYTG